MSKSIPIILLFGALSINAACTFPNPCDTDNTNFKTLSSSKPVLNSIDKNKFTTDSLNWAWTKLFEQTSIGAKRLSDEIPDTLPIGEILLPSDGLVIGLDKEKFEKIIDLKIIDLNSNKIIYSNKEITQFTIIPKNILSFGKNYKIICNVIGDSSILNIDEHFNILPQNIHKEFENTLSKSTLGIENQKEKDFIKAVLYFDNGYDYNGNAEILKIKKIK